MKVTLGSTCFLLFLLACSTAKKTTMPVELPTFDKQGHRGSRGLMPENTIPAMHRAIDLGVTTLEMNVVISKDKKVVRSHEPYLNSDITTTPEGKIRALLHPAPEEFVDLVFAVIQNEGIPIWTVIQSFDMPALKVVRQKYPSLETSLWIEDKDERTFDEQRGDLGFIPTIYGPHCSMVKGSVVKPSHDKAMKIIPWTVNSREEIERLKSCGVDGIITDFPDLF